MKYLLICAVDSEVAGLRALLENRVDTEKHGFVFSEGTLFGKPTIVVKCGVGKVNAALCTQTALMLYSPDAVVNVGVGGGVGTGVITGCVTVATETFQYDFDLTAVGESDGMLIPCDAGLSRRLYEAAVSVLGQDHVFRGRTATGDRFVGDAETVTRLRDKYGSLSCDMEGGAVAQVCAASGVPCGVLRAVSDNANEKCFISYYTFLESAVENAQKIITAFLSTEDPV